MTMDTGRGQIANDAGIPDRFYTEVTKHSSYLLLQVISPDVQCDVHLPS